MLVEWGLELLAGAAFVFVLLRSLKKSGAKAAPDGAAGASPDTELTQAILALQNATEGDSSAEELARRHVEELLQADPDRVGALLSRWALGEDYYKQKVNA
jgi:flagellar biosynthesis/type III secretory pathway M-ring protein FliF/YscJ